MWRLAIYKTEGGVVIGSTKGREGVIVGEVEDGISRVLGSVLVLVVEVGADRHRVVRVVGGLG